MLPFPGIFTNSTQFSKATDHSSHESKMTEMQESKMNHKGDVWGAGSYLSWFPLTPVMHKASPD